MYRSFFPGNIRTKRKINSERNSLHACHPWFDGFLEEKANKAAFPSLSFYVHISKNSISVLILFLLSGNSQNTRLLHRRLHHDTFSHRHTHKRFIILIKKPISSIFYFLNPNISSGPWNVSCMKCIWSQSSLTFIFRWISRFCNTSQAVLKRSCITIRTQNAHSYAAEEGFLAKKHHVIDVDQ